MYVCAIHKINYSLIFALMTQFIANLSLYIKFIDRKIGLKNNRKGADFYISTLNNYVTYLNLISYSDIFTKILIFFL